MSRFWLQSQPDLQEFERAALKIRRRGQQVKLHWLGRAGIVKLTEICVIGPQDIMVDALRGPTCWVSQSA